MNRETAFLIIYTYIIKNKKETVDRTSDCYPLDNASMRATRAGHPLANFIDKSSDLNPTPPVAAIIRLFGISKRLSVTRLGRGLVAIIIIANATIYLLRVPACTPRRHNRLFNLIRNHARKKKRYALY